VVNCQKNALRNQALSIGFSVSALQALTPKTQNQNSLFEKCQLIYWRLFDCVIQVDTIEGQDTGNKTLGLRELGTAERLKEKSERLMKFVQGESQEPTRLAVTS